jgi:homoserine O-succinyltransferase
MPVCVVKGLPANKTLRDFGIFVMDEERARTQDIRPLKMLVVNLMPDKQTTETQLLRLLSNTPLQVIVHFLYTTTHDAKHVAASHLQSFYKTLDEVRGEYYDGLIITGAPVETLPFKEVDYWQELTEIFDWSTTHVYSTLHICWGAQAGLYYRYGIGKQTLPRKLFGVYRCKVNYPNHPLFRGFDKEFNCPQSRHTASYRQALYSLHFCDKVEILSDRVDGDASVGPVIAATPNLREIYSFGHLEYDPLTLDREYRRDCAAGLSIYPPANYYPDALGLAHQPTPDYPRGVPESTWRSAASLFFSNWINVVYQGTPYRIQDISEESRYVDWHFATDKW